MNNGEKLAKVLEYYEISYDVRGDKGKAICPFHPDVNPSMALNFDDGSWFCFACGASGTAYNFVQRMESALGERLNDLQALQVLEGICSASYTRNLRAIRNSPRRRERPAESVLHAEACDYYYGLASVPWTAPQCVLECVEADEARDYMAARGYKPKTLELAGAKVTYNRSYPIIFPISDNGDFMGWVCRTFSHDVAKRAKYLYNEGFRRAITLCGNYSGENKSPLIICEGFFDLMRFWQAGYISNVIALLGCLISHEQVEKIKNAKITHVISALDNDVAGEKGTQKLRQYFEVTRFEFPLCVKDPGEMSDDEIKSAMQCLIDCGLY